MPVLSLQTPSTFDYDDSLLVSCLALLLLGLVMVASASIHNTQTAFPLYYFWRQTIHIGIGVILASIVVRIPIQIWQRLSIPLLLIGCSTLLLVLVPGIGNAVKGSMRWIVLGSLKFQPSELIKPLITIYLAGYLVRRSHEVRGQLRGFLKPLMVVCIVTGLLLLEPDYGATVVLFATVLGMLFLAGVPMWQFIAWAMVISSALFLLILLAPYRLVRLTTFLNPWADPFNSGFQLTQALIAIGRGEILGVGLGNSIQKTYLPEAHTDFLFAILAEELGLIGVVTVIALFAFIVLRAFSIAIYTERLGLYYAAYLAYGLGLIIGLQASINLGVNMGLLPTKGLTLPLMSYGGSSMVVTCFMIGLLLRIDHETRLKASKRL